MRWFAIFVAACSPPSVAATIDAAAADAAVADPSKIYHGMLDQTPPVQFGGGTYCTYSITLTTLAVEITVRSGAVTAATVQNLNVEGIVGTCPFTPSPPSIAKYTLATAKPITDGTSLDFTGDPGNQPKVALTIDMIGDTATATFHRTDQVDVLNWTVMTNVTLASP